VKGVASGKMQSGKEGHRVTFGHRRTEGGGGSGMLYLESGRDTSTQGDG